MKTYISEWAKKLEMRRFQAGNWFNKGKKNKWVAKHFQVSIVAVWKWRKAWNEDKKGGLKSKGPCGVKGRLSWEKLKKIDALLLQGPEKNGFPSPLWTLDRVAEVIEDLTGVSYYRGHVWKILHFLGWSNQRPVRRAKERNEKAIRMWRKEVWPALQKKGSRTEQPLVSLMKQVSPIAR